MPFPEVERVHFKKNTLVEVVCQIRFPPILKIDSCIPSEFQEDIRDEFPLFEEKIEFQQEIQINLNQGQVSNQQILPIQTKNYEFASEDGLWKINLTRTFITITCKKYERWEDFCGKFIKPLESLKKYYSPAFVTRIGLRYINVYCREDLGLTDVPWRELFKPCVLGLLSNDYADKIKTHSSTNEIQLSEPNQLATINTALGINEKQHIGFLVDSDFYNGQKNQFEVIMAQLSSLNSASRRFMRSIISERLYEALEPEKI